MRNQNVAIVGAGILGRFLAYQLYKTNRYDITLYDKNELNSFSNCSSAAGGLLSPISELETGHIIISQLGWDSLKLWKNFIKKQKSAPFFQQEGSLIVAHPQEFNDLHHFQEKISSLCQSEAFTRRDGGGKCDILSVGKREINELEPELNRRFTHGLFLSQEAQISPRETLQFLMQQFFDWQKNNDPKKSQANFYLRFQEEVEEISPHLIVTHFQGNEKKEIFDWVIDCRGLGAQTDMPRLRGVRGELIWVRAPDVQLTRPVRLMHPRYPLYVIPRPDSIYLLGATSIESQHQAPISVRSTLELLSAAYSLHSGFAEASLLETVVQWRPALEDHLPRIFHQPGLMRINGLYRHGFLISPQIVDLILSFLVDENLKNIPLHYQSLFHHNQKQMEAVL